MNTTELRYASHDGVSTIRALVWEPEQRSISVPRGIVQLVHGMAEHVERYAQFAQFLTSQGFVVCANDHVGHGKSAATKADLGHIPMQRGADILIEDANMLRLQIQARFTPEVPYVLFGHSMGSFIVRAYCARYGQGLAAAILCGTGNQPRVLSLFGNAVAHVLGAVRGERASSSFLRSQVEGAFTKAVANAQTGADWICTDQAVVQAYIADPLCGQAFTVGGYAALTALTAEVVRPSHEQALPKALPLLFIAGTEDPVGECGKAVSKAVALYKKAGLVVDEIIYEGMRHEILNEPGHAQVYADIEQWLSGQGI